MAGSPDPYRTLGVPRGATLRQIKVAHRALAKRYHPDAPTADPAKFLLAQEAYQLLADPLRRKEWDARHTSAPLRADDPPGPASRSRARRSPTQGGPPPSGGYRWSASEVPWWEEAGRRSRPAQDPAEGDSGGGVPPRSRRRPPPDAGPAADDNPAEQPQRADFDVYNRSSGAAWSAAARAYFRRADHDLPRRGSFQYQGSQPLTAARARAAAEEARRQAGPSQPGPQARPAADQAAAAPRAGHAARSGPRPTPPPQSAQSVAASPRADAPAGARAQPAGRPANASVRAAAGPAAPARPAAPEVGVARDVNQISRARARVRAAERAARWPSSFQRLRYAILAWAPLALLIGYGGPVAAGCDPALADCPRLLLPGQALIGALALLMLLLLPRVAYAGALATTALALLGGAAVLGAIFAGVRPPQLASLPPWAVLVGSVLLLIAYALVGTWLLADARRRPWAAVRIRR